MSAPRSVRWARSSFLRLLSMLPRRIRARHGDEIGALFTELLEEAHASGGPIAVVGVWCRSVLDLALSRDLERVPEERSASGPGFRAWDPLRQDVRLALRNMRARPGLTLLAVGSLAVGMGATVGIFTFADTTLWAPWAFHDPDRVVQVFEQRDEYLLPSWPTFRHVQEHVDLFDGVLASQLDLFALGGTDGGARTLAGERVSGDYFRVLGLPAQLGRYPATQDEASGTLPVVLSHHTWTSAFGADPRVIGRSLRLNGHPGVVVAVAPEALDGTKWGVSAELWVPMDAWARAAGWDEWADDPGLTVTVMARMKDGVDVAAVDAALLVLSNSLAERRPERYTGATLVATDRLRGDMGPRIGVTADLIALTAVLAGVLVLLVGCGNVASLLLARGVLRRKEIAVRHALGASRARVIRQLMTESLLLAGLAAGLGLLLSRHGAEALLNVLPVFDFRVRFETAPGPRGWWLAGGLTVLAVVAAGLAPALQLSRTDLARAMNVDARGGAPVASRRLLSAVVVGMVGASVLALFLAGVFGRTLARGQAFDPGFETDRRLMAVVPLRLAGHGWRDATPMFEDLERRVEALPGVASVGYATGVPLGESWTTAQVYAADRDYPTGEVGVRSFRSSVSDGYFQAMGTRLVAGRPFGPQDGAEGPWVAIVNEVLAERVWPGENPLGRRIRFGLDDDAEPVEVVGVAESGLYYQVGEAPEPAVFASFRQWAQAQALVVVETEGDPLALVPSLRAVLDAIDPNVPLQRPRTAETHMRWALWLHRMGARIGAAVSVLSILMASAGLYGVMAFTLGSRRHEMGVRRALGAGRQEVMGLAMASALRLTLLGLALGAILSGLVGSVLRATLPGVRPWDPLVFAAVAAVVLLVGAAAGLLPGVSASRVDPVRALTAE